MTKTKTTNLTAEQLEKKFNDGDDDISDHFRPIDSDGLPEPDFVKKKVSAELPLGMIKKLDELSKESGNTRSAIIRTLLVSALSKLS